ncbi:MAG: Fis family transcriptional regulator [Candidatus Zixiibacteriota bacterium]|nr:MAG: Fis family transcriptional regulator [candidate division Zixibacteria bacterium]
MTNKNKSDTTEVILDSIAEGVFTVNKDWRITSFNKAAEKITGISKKEAINQRCCDVFHASICENDCALRKTFETKKPVVCQSVYIIDTSGNRIPISISTAVLRDKNGNIVGGVETFRDLSAIEELKRELEKKYSFHNIISKNNEMLKIFDSLPSIAQSDSVVLIEGKTGTGKELIARALHDLSSRSKKSIVSINCGALPDTLLESELFGYKAGAFTDARKDKPGRFALAEKGTIFLDEIAEISQALQVKLLRVIQERTYEPLGGTKPIKSDVRIIAATNVKIEDLVKSGQVREDFYYRINVIRIKLPPLCERKEDIPLLIEHFIRRFNNLKNKYISDISHEALMVLINYDFPGNIRELENIIEHAFVLCKSKIIELEDLPEFIKPKETSSMVKPTSMNELESEYLRKALKKNNWSRKKTAEDIGIHKTTLWRKIKKFGIEIPNKQ